MAVHTGMGSALSLGKLGVALGKGHMAHAAASAVLGFSLTAVALAVVVGTLLLVEMTDSEAPDNKKPKAEQI